MGNGQSFVVHIRSFPATSPYRSLCFITMTPWDVASIQWIIYWLLLHRSRLLIATNKIKICSIRTTYSTDSLPINSIHIQMGYPAGVIFIMKYSTNRLHRWCKNKEPIEGWRVNGEWAKLRSASSLIPSNVSIAEPLLHHNTSMGRCVDTMNNFLAFAPEEQPIDSNQQNKNLLHRSNLFYRSFAIIFPLHILRHKWVTPLG